ncbi:Peroxisomal NADH pyrophosphatase NUDT12 [Lamellibrachia satsuma]|nr:Peroxisomal NADH pyrophosphatase NUDT12 [Lamellibrachia satsuma]
MADDTLQVSFLGNQGGNHDDNIVNFMSDDPLNRLSHRRKDRPWLDTAMSKDSTRFVLFSNLNPVCVPAESTVDSVVTSQSRQRQLLTVIHESIKSYLEEHKPVVIFLGISCLKDDTSAQIDSGTCYTEETSPAWFAVDATAMPLDQFKQFDSRAALLSVYPGMTRIEPAHAAVYAQARALLAWHDRHRFCATCGCSTSVEDGGYKRKCTDEDCRSLQGVHNTCHPRVDPSVIMAVSSTDKSQLLLGRGHKFPPCMWSCLAGFIEPGESIEDACRREVVEESGVCVGRVRYHSSQTWPMPSSLMIGCLADALTSEVTVDKKELDHARWFTREEIQQMLQHRHPQGLFLAPKQAIAHQLVLQWFNTTNL